MVQNLLSEVTKASGIAIHTRGDCEFLSALILEETDRRKKLKELNKKNRKKKLAETAK